MVTNGGVTVEMLRQVVAWAQAHCQLEQLALPWPEVHEDMLKALRDKGYCNASTT